MLAQELVRPVMRKVYVRFKDNIWAADLAEMGSLSSLNHGVKYFWCVTDVLITCAWFNPLKDKKAKTGFHGFIEIVSKSKC